MSPQVIVYSPDEIRARIISKTLKTKGIKTSFFTTHFEFEEAIQIDSPPYVLIVDVKKNLQEELKFLTKLSHNLPESTFIIQSDPSDSTTLENLNINNKIVNCDPIEPEHILAEVEATLIARRRSGIKRYFRILKGLYQRVLRVFFKAVPIVITLIAGLCGGYIYWCVSTLPNINVLKDYSPYEASKLYSQDNKLLTEFYVERRTFIPYDMIPEHVLEAFIAVEDSRYYRHHGIDLFRIISALWTNIRKGTFAQGGSTITQQLAKRLFLKPEKTITRKIKEIALSLNIEKNFTKKEILVLYLNHAYFGERAYGIEAASQVYFGKSVGDISIAEAALLAALPRAPSKNSPFEDQKRSLERRNYVLQRMLKTDFINARIYDEAISNKLPERAHRRNFHAPYFVDYCRTVLEERYGDRLYTSGLKIYSTLDYKMQQIAERALQKGIERLKKRKITDVQAALIALDLKSGQIKAMVGGTNYSNSQFNRVTQAKRQPGSVFKPIVYITALKQGFNPEDTVEDNKTFFKWKKGGEIWAPENYKKTYHGTVTLTKALALSLNSATLNLARQVGLKNIIKTAEELGIKSKIHPFYSSALGASELTLMEMAYTYSTFAHGNRLKPMCIERIIDREESTLMEPREEKQRVINKKVLKNIKSMLEAVILRGTGRRAQVLMREVYGKTGTTNDYADAWFIGFDENTLAGVWVGRDGRLPIFEGATGASVALPIWIEFMRDIY